MSENVLKALQQLVQDVIAPDVRESKVRIEALDKRVDQRFSLLEQKMDLQFQAIMAAIGESKPKQNWRACA